MILCRNSCNSDQGGDVIDDSNDSSSNNKNQNDNCRCFRCRRPYSITAICWWMMLLSVILVGTVLFFFSVQAPSMDNVRMMTLSMTSRPSFQYKKPFQQKYLYHLQIPTSWIPSLSMPHFSLLPKKQANSNTAFKPVKVRIYIESLCIDSQRYMIEQVLPTYEALFGNHSIMDLQIIVFGNAHYNNNNNNSISTDSQQVQNNDKDELICQHGIAECDANVYSLCVQTLYRSTIARYLPFIMCLFDGRLPMGYHNETYPKSIFAQCAKETGIVWSYIMDECYNNRTMIDEIQYRAYQETLVTNHSYVPWVTLNDEHLVNEDQRNLLQEILARGGMQLKCRGRRNC